MNVTEQQLRSIVASFLKIEEGSVHENTVIDNTAIKGSIMVHRMYAVIARELKQEIKNYSQLKTFGQLLDACAASSREGGNLAGADNKEKVFPPTGPMVRPGVSVGIDIEDVENMPRVADCRADDFYRRNFSSREISYCILQQEPWHSFAGKFAAKEAIVKADNSYRNVPFSAIEINHDEAGKPYFRNFAISISHNKGHAVAVAILLFL